jgi:hypothetical protein
VSRPRCGRRCAIASQVNHLGHVGVLQPLKQTDQLVVRVPLFNQKTEEEKQDERRAKAEQEARARYLASPVGKAEAAYRAGQMFFQLTINISEIEGRASDWDYSQSTRIRRFNAVDTLGQIEEMGWHLEHVGYIFVETGEVARSKVMSSGLVTRTQGYVEGIYLFRRSR